MQGNWGAALRAIATGVLCVVLASSTAPQMAWAQAPDAATVRRAEALATEAKAAEAKARAEQRETDRARQDRVAAEREAAEAARKRAEAERKAREQLQSRKRPIGTVQATPERGLPRAPIGATAGAAVVSGVFFALAFDEADAARTMEGNLRSDADKKEYLGHADAARRNQAIAWGAGVVTVAPPAGWSGRCCRATPRAPRCSPHRRLPSCW